VGSAREATKLGIASELITQATHALGARVAHRGSVEGLELRA